jgi:SAM-dependent methyltransferase
MDSQIEREIEFHDRRFAHEGGQRYEDRFYVALKPLYADFWRQVQGFAHAADVLDYGCGSGDNALRLVNCAAPRSLTGVDISPVAVALARSEAERVKATIRFEVGDAHCLPFADASFDLVMGSGILHHLRLADAAREIARVLRPGGRMVFVEPLATNPAIALFRRMTPNSRSPDEHPLRPRDFDGLREQFGQLDVRHYGLMTLVAIPWRRLPGSATLMSVLAAADKVLLSLPASRWLAWSVLCVGKK